MALVQEPVAPTGAAAVVVVVAAAIRVQPVRVVALDGIALAPMWTVPMRVALEAPVIRQA